MRHDGGLHRGIEREVCLLQLSLNAVTLGLMGTNRFTLSEVASLVGAKAHAVQYWAREGILRPDPETIGAGRGKHRTFPAGEVRVAAVAAALGPFGMSVPLLRVICDHVRPVVTPEVAGEVPPGTSRAIQAMRAEE